MHTHQWYGTKDGLDSLHVILDKMQLAYGSTLEEESIKKHITLFAIWVELARQGSTSAANYLRQHGPKILAVVKERLNHAAETMHHKYPTDQAIRYAAADYLDEAATLAAEAENTFKYALQHEICH